MRGILPVELGQIGTRCRPPHGRWVDGASPTGRPFTEDEIRQLLSFAQRYEHSADLRRWVGYVILVIFASTGFRNSELRSLQTDNVNLSRRELRVVGKGSKERIIPFGAGRPMC
ncbi:MAG: tyrosine-type recombinase/integrase [Candidatus Dormibacteria bacterium]